MSENVIKQNVGIDIAKKTFTAAISKVDSQLDYSISKTKDFTNNKAGHNEFWNWAKKVATKGVELRFVLEPTSTYHLPLAIFLKKKCDSVYLAHTTQVRNYRISLGKVSKTDVIDAQVIARFGLERSASLFTIPSTLLLELRSLSRHVEDLNKKLTSTKNQLSTYEDGGVAKKSVLRELKAQIKLFEKQKESSIKDAENLIFGDKELAEKANLLMTIPGIGFQSVFILIAETYGFQHFTNAKRLAAFAGYGVVQYESGSSVCGKSRISKRGNSMIRWILHQACLSAIRFNPPIKKFYERLRKNGKPKMVAMVAAQRKLLCIAFSMWKNDTKFDPDFESKKQKKEIANSELKQENQEDKKVQISDHLVSKDDDKQPIDDKKIETQPLSQDLDLKEESDLKVQKKTVKKQKE